MATWRISHGNLTNFTVVSLLFPFLNHRSSLKWPCLPVFRPGEEGGLERLLGWSSVTWKMARLPHQNGGWYYGWYMVDIWHLVGLINGLINMVDICRKAGGLARELLLLDQKAGFHPQKVPCQTAFCGEVWIRETRTNCPRCGPGQVAKWVHSNPLPAKISEAGHKRWLQMGFWEFCGARHDCIH